MKQIFKSTIIYFQHHLITGDLHCQLQAFFCRHSFSH